MAIRIESTSTGKSESGTSLTINTPVGAIDGDVLLAFTSAVNTISPPGTWTEALEANTGNVNITVSYLVVSGTLSSAYTWTIGADTQSAGGIVLLSGVNTGAIINASGNSGSSSDATPFCPAVTTTVDNCLVFRATGFFRTDYSLSSYPPDHTALWDSKTVANGGMRCSVAYERQLHSGDTGFDSFTFATASTCRNWTVAIAPGSTTGAVGGSLIQGGVVNGI